MALTYADDNNFEKEVEACAEPKMVAFYASWCPHCHRMMPVFEEAARQYDGKVKVFAVDVDKSPKASAKYGVRAIPTMLFFRSAQNFDTLSGEQPLEALKRQLDLLK